DLTNAINESRELERRNPAFDVIPAAMLLMDAAESISEMPDNVKLNIVAADNGSLVRVRRSLITDALNNIIQNAIKAMPNGGTLTLTARDQGKMVKLEVADTGIGIHPEDQPHIFDL